MYIETKRLIIRDLELSDETPYIEMASDGSLHDIFGDYSDCQNWMGNWLEESILLAKQDNPHTEYLAYSIIEKATHIVIGSIGCSYYEDLNQIGITYFIGSSYRRKGYASEATSAYTTYFLDHYDIPALIATIRTDNIASCKTIEKAGYVLKKTKQYKDINDSKEVLYHFYEKTESL